MVGDSSPVVVDLGGLGEVGAWLRHEAQLLTHGIKREVHFGQHSPCGETNAARWALASAIDHHSERADRRMREIQALASTIDEVVTRYRQADTAGETSLNKLGQ